MLTLRQLRYFVAVVEAGSMTRAAESLHVAPTALSLQIKALEEHFGAAFVRRHSRGVAPTEAGVELCERARAILALVEQTERHFMPHRTLPDRPVQLGIPPGLAGIVGVEAFLGMPPPLKGLELRIAEGWTVDLARKLLAGELDLVVGYGLKSGDALHVTDLVEDRLVFVGTPNGDDDATISLEAALETNLIFYGEASVGWRAVRDAARAAGLPLLAEQHVESIRVWRELMSRGVGTSIAPFGVIAEEFVRGEVVIRELDGPPVTFPISLAIRRELMEEGWAARLVDYITALVRGAHAHFSTPFRAPADPV
jgi:LysR family transcriptional regulator, nitrogen assimilation regulatory protein